MPVQRQSEQLDEGSARRCVCRGARVGRRRQAMEEVVGLALIRLRVRRLEQLPRRRDLHDDDAPIAVERSHNLGG